MTDTEQVLRTVLRERAGHVDVPEDFDQRVQRWKRSLTIRRRRRLGVTVVAISAVVAVVINLFVADGGAPSDVVVAGTGGATTIVATTDAPATTATTTTTTTAPAGPAATCRGADLRILLGHFGFAAGSAGQTILLTNLGAQPCSLVALR